MKHKKLLVFLILLLGIWALNHHFGWSKLWLDIGFWEDLQHTVKGNLIVSLALYVVLTVAGCVVLALPGITFAVVASLLFGPWTGTAACLVATTLGALLSFWAGRFFLKDSIKPLVTKNKHLNALLFSGSGQKETFTLLITRMLPIFPYNLQNFAYGITDISSTQYIVCTFLFMLPGVALFTFGTAGVINEAGRVRYMVISAVLALAIGALSYRLHRSYSSKTKQDDKSQESYPMNRRAMILFTRVPISGQTKTRLEPFLSADECAELNKAMLGDVSQTLYKVDADVYVFFTPEEYRNILCETIGTQWPMQPQKGVDLGEKMDAAIRDVLSMGYRSCILIGSDVPQVTTEDIQRAFEILDEMDMVIAPTEDGGYYLIGMKEPCPEVFRMEYGGASVYGDTVAQIRSMGKSCGEGVMKLDIDDRQDMMRLWDLANQCGSISYAETKRFLDWLHQEGRI